MEDPPFLQDFLGEVQVIEIDITPESKMAELQDIERWAAHMNDVMAGGGRG